MTSYDEVAYPSLPLPQATPSQLATQAALLGLPAPPDPQRCRVLEIGCSDAGHLAWLAARAPGSTFLGVDLSVSAVDRAREAISGLDNVEVRVGDLTTLDEGPFDIVLAHGILSWLPDPSALLACVDRHLSAQGIAYVSYNVLPGAFVRRIVGDPMARWSLSQPDPLAAARRLAAWIAQGTVESAHAEIARSAARLALAKPDHLLVHDDLAEPNRAFYFDEFVELAARHDLAYLSETHLADSQPPPGVVWPDDLAGLVAGDEVASQQLLDYARNRAFRQTLLVRPGNVPSSHKVDARRLPDLWAAAPAEVVERSGSRSRVRLRGEVELTTDNAAVLADLDVLGATWPGSVPVSRLRTDPATLLHLHLSRALELRLDPCPAVRPGERPLVDPYVRVRAAADGRLASLRHEPLELEDDLSRAAVAMMDGRTSRSAIAAALVAMPGAPRLARTHLDALIDQLAPAGLFLG